MEPGGGPSAAGLSCQEVTSGTGKKAGRIGFFHPTKDSNKKTSNLPRIRFYFFFLNQIILSYSQVSLFENSRIQE